MSAPTVERPNTEPATTLRAFLPCLSCHADAVFVIGGAGVEVRECFACGRRSRARRRAVSLSE